MYFTETRQLGLEPESARKDKRQTNLVPRSHSVTGNVRSGKVRQYIIFHWLLKKGCGNAIYAPIGLFRGALSEGLFFASSCAVLNKCQLCGGKFWFFPTPEKLALQLRKIILKICDVCVNGTDGRPMYPSTHKLMKFKLKYVIYSSISRS